MPDVNLSFTMEFALEALTKDLVWVDPFHLGSAWRLNGGTSIVFDLVTPPPQHAMYLIIHFKILSICVFWANHEQWHIHFPWVAKFQVPLDLSTILGGWDAALALRNLGCRSEVGARIRSGGQASNKDVRSYYLGVFGRTISVTYPKFDGFSMLILFFCSKITILVVDSIFRHVFLLSGTTPTWHNQWTSGDDQWKTTKAQKHERTHSIW